MLKAMTKAAGLAAILLGTTACVAGQRTVTTTAYPPGYGQPVYSDGYGYGGVPASSGYGQPAYADGACVDSPDDAIGGAVIGAILGGIVGNQIGPDPSNNSTNAVIGAVLGGAAGAAIGENARQCDEYYAAQAYYSAFDNDPYVQSDWSNPYTGNYGTVRPMAWYDGPYGEDCREFESTIWVGGRRQIATGTACRQPDGTWQVVD